MMIDPFLRTLCYGTLLVASISLLSCASSKKSTEGVRATDPAFESRFASLTQSLGVVALNMGADDSAASMFSTSSHALRHSGPPPATLTPHDILAVLKSNMTDVRRCYKKQLEDDPEWAEQFILDLSVKKTGHISEVGFSPSRVMRAVFGQCLNDAITGWTFPEFTGESEDGMQEVVTASLPLSLSPG